MTARRHFLRSLSALISMSPLAGKAALPGLVTQRPRPLIIDADTANEVDDLFAIAYALAEPALEIVGITSAQWHTSPRAPNDTVGLSQQFNEDIVRLMGKTNIPLPEGANIPLVNKSRPQRSEAAEFIIDKGMSTNGDEKLDIVILGPCTNIASAVLLEPRLIDRIVVNYLGFWHDEKNNTWSKREFNSNNDPNAVNVLLDTRGLEFNVMTASTSQHLVFSKENVDRHLKGKGGVADYLVRRWETFDRYWQKEDPEKLQWIMWDVAIIQALATPDLATKKNFETPHDNLSRTISAYTSIDVEGMKKRYWSQIDKFLKQ